MILACTMAAIAFLPFSNHKSGCRKKLLIVAALSLIPIIAKMIFSIFPLLEARIMPVDIYAAIQKDFWLPFAVLFFCLGQPHCSFSSSQSHFYNRSFAGLPFKSKMLMLGN
jgi:hypothetical protein